jgi:hypothetical protein
MNVIKPSSPQAAPDPQKDTMITLINAEEREHNRWFNANLNLLRALEQGMKRQGSHQFAAWLIANGLAKSVLRVLQSRTRTYHSYSLKHELLWTLADAMVKAGKSIHED